MKTGFASPNFPKKRALEIQRQGGLSHDSKHMAKIGRKGGKETQWRAFLQRQVDKREDKIWTIDASTPI